MIGRILIFEPDPERRAALELDCAARGYEIVCARDLHRALAAHEACTQERERAAGRRPLVAASQAMIGVLEEIERLTAERTSVLMVGEAGVGKEALARALHAQSPRRGAPFAVADVRPHAVKDPAALLLGAGDAIPAEGSAASGQIALAAGGTLFLEGVDALPWALQEELVGLLQEGRIALRGDEKPRSVDVRVVATRCERRESPDDDGSLHPELREGLAPLRVPPLRERREDLPLLIDHALARACAHLGRSALGIGGEALRQLVAHAWPGNLRELEATILTGAVHAAGGVLTARELPDEIAREASADTGHDALALKPARKAFESDWIRRALRVAGGNRTHAARLLEISHRALLYKLKEFGIKP